MPELAQAFGSRVRQLRTSAGITQEQLAARASMHPLQIAHIESGDRQPRLTTILALAKALDVTPGELVNAAAAGAAR